MPISLDDGTLPSEFLCYILGGKINFLFWTGAKDASIQNANYCFQNGFLMIMYSEELYKISFSIIKYSLLATPNFGGLIESSDPVF